MNSRFDGSRVRASGLPHKNCEDRFYENETCVPAGTEEDFLKFL